MSRLSKWGIAGLFAAITAIPAAAQDYTVIEVFAPPAPVNAIVPDRELPPPGPRRAAAERWVRDVPVTIDSYTVLMRDDAGQHVQCAGVRVDGDAPVLGYLTFDSLATSLPLLRLMHGAPRAGNWPVQLGGCTAVAAADVRERLRSPVQWRLGGDIVLEHQMRVYGRESDEQRAVRMLQEIEGGISTRGNAVFRCAAAGWNETLRRAQTGARVTLPGLCPG